VRTLTVVCPVHNEQEVVAAFHAELRRLLDSIAGRWAATILLVDDGSTDRTREVLRDIAARDPSARVITLSAHFGQQAALLAGLDHSESDAVVMMDSDLQHPPALIPRLLDAFEQGADVVFTIREDSPEVPVWKRVSSRWFYRMINAISDTPINENAADFRLVSRRVVEVFRGRLRERSQFLRGLFGWVGFPTAYVRFRVSARPAGKTKYSVRRMLRFAVDGVVSFSKTPLQAAVYVGVAFGALGLLSALVTLVQYLVYRSFPPGWTMAVILISIFSGIQLVFLGILGEYVGAIFDEVKARPHYLVDERINFPPRPGPDA
jgi:dolichol-phosphate mannosyltransferase